MFTLRLLASFVCIIFVFNVVLVPSANADWAIFRANPSNDGVGTGNPVLTPTLLWKTNTSYVVLNAISINTIWSSPTVVNGLVYISSGTGAVTSYAYFDQTFGSSWGDVYAFNATSGVVVWEYRYYYSSSDPDIPLGFSSPTVVNGVVFFAFYNYVDALNASDGVSLWNFTAGNLISFGGLGSPTVVNGIVYIGAYPSGIYALSATNGDSIWNYTIGGAVNSSPAVTNGVVYISSFVNDTYALNAKNGAELWNAFTGAGVSARAVVVGGVVYVDNDNSGVLYALDAYNGEQLWNYTLQGNDLALVSPAIDNGVLYVGSSGQVYALGLPMSSPSPTPATSLISSKTLSSIVGGTVAVIIVATAVFLMLQKRLKTKTKNPTPLTPVSCLRSRLKIIIDLMRFAGF